jgi:hypothetical protein
LGDFHPGTADIRVILRGFFVYKIVYKLFYELFYKLYNKGMARRKLGDRNIRRLIKIGGRGSVGITIPIEIMRGLKWRATQKVVVTRRGKEIRIKDWPVSPKRSKGGKPKKK